MCKHVMTDYRDTFKQLFETTYVSARGRKIDIYNKMTSFLNEVLPNIPEKLYRYRRIDDAGYTINAFKNGTISVCKPKCFSDKYDSLVFVDSEKVVEEMKQGTRNALMDVVRSIRNKDPNVRAEKASRLCYCLEQGMTEDEAIEKILEELYSDFFNTVNHDLKQREFRFRDSEKTARIACFTESVQSKFMWDTYAGGYRGFALEYNLREYLIRCFNKDIPVYVFPVIYTDERPDLTTDESNFYTFSKMQEKGWLHKLDAFRPLMDYNMLSVHKPFLYKDKEEYGHEREWRIMYYDKDSRDDYMEIPDEECLNAIYYGPDIKQEDYDRFHQIATAKGIREYKVSIDDNSRKYNLSVKPL